MLRYNQNKISLSYLFKSVTDAEGLGRELVPEAVRQTPG